MSVGGCCWWRGDRTVLGEHAYAGDWHGRCDGVAVGGPDELHSRKGRTKECHHDLLPRGMQVHVDLVDEDDTGVGSCFALSAPRSEPDGRCRLR
jgi:hypothetical protein